MFEAVEKQKSILVQAGMSSSVRSLLSQNVRNCMQACSNTTSRVGEKTFIASDNRLHTAHGGKANWQTLNEGCVSAWCERFHGLLGEGARARREIRSRNRKLSSRRRGIYV